MAKLRRAARGGEAAAGELREKRRRRAERLCVWDRGRRTFGTALDMATAYTANASDAAGKGRKHY